MPRRATEDWDLPPVQHSTRNASPSKYNHSIVNASEVIGRGAKVIAIITVDELWMNMCSWKARTELDCCGVFLLFHLKQPNNRWTPHRLCRLRSERDLEAFKTLQQPKCAVFDVLFSVLNYSCYFSVAMTQKRTWIVRRVNRMAKETWKHQTSHLSEDVGHSAW